MIYQPSSVPVKAVKSIRINVTVVISNSITLCGHPSMADTLSLWTPSYGGHPLCGHSRMADTLFVDTPVWRTALYGGHRGTADTPVWRTPPLWTPLYGGQPCMADTPPLWTPPLWTPLYSGQPCMADTPVWRTHIMHMAHIPVWRRPLMADTPVWPFFYILHFTFYILHFTYSSLYKANTPRRRTAEAGRKVVRLRQSSPLNQLSPL